MGRWTAWRNKGIAESKDRNSTKEWESAFGGLVVRSDIAEAVSEFQEMSVESSKINSKGEEKEKDKQHVQEPGNNHRRYNAGTVGIPKEQRKKGAEEMCGTQYQRTS